MAISTSVAVRDNMSAAFMNITNAINVCLGTFVDLQSATAEGVGAEHIQEMHNALNDMNASAALFNEEMQRVNSTTSQTPSNIEEASNKQQQFNNEIARGASHTDNLINKIKGMIGAYASWKAGEKVLEMSDTLANTTARIDMMNDGLNSTEDVMKRIYASAQDARGGYIEMASTVAKLGNNAREAFSSTNEIIDFANLVQKQFVNAGAGADEAKNAMLQLTQALGSGVLRGDELNSIFEQAPNIIRNISDYLGVPIGKIRDMASEGQITADIVKNAMFSASDEINSKFNNMPVTFAQVATRIKNDAIVAFQPILNMIGRITSTQEFATMSEGIVNAFYSIASVAEPILQGLIDGAAWVVNNWSAISPVIYGVVGAITAYKLITEITAVVQGIMTGLVSAAAAAYGVEAAAVTGAMIAQTAFNAVLNACPLMLIVTLIGLVIMAIARWVQSVGGIKIAWMICVDKVMYGWDLLKIGFTIGVHAIQNKCDAIKLAFNTTNYMVSSAIGLMKVNVLTHIQNMVNGAISMINDFISMLNKIPGVSIDLISHVSTIGMDAAAAEASRQASAYKDLQADKANYDKNVAEREKNDLNATTKALDDHEKRLNEIAKAQKAAKADKSKGTGVGVPSFKMPKYSTPEVGAGGTAANIDKNTGSTAANTKRAADALEVTEDNLAWMKDIAEREIIDRTVFRDIKVNLGGVKNTVNNLSDLDGIADYIGDAILEKVQIGAEGA